MGAGQSVAPPTGQSNRQRLVAALRSRVPVILLHGRAGTGKTTLIQSLKEEGFRHVVVAPTGIAALNAGGQTIHSFFGIPLGIVNLEDIKPRHRLGSILRRIDVIVIDEVSMVRADLLDAIDRSLRVNLELEDIPFGGKKLLLEHRGYEVTHAFGAKCLFAQQQIRMIELSNVYRQSNFEFLEYLQNIRTGGNLDATVPLLNLRCHRQHRSTAKPVILTPTAAAASDYNRRGLAALAGKPTRFVGTIEKQFRVVKDKLPAPEYLDLKKDARILMVKNDPEHRWVNGSSGTVSRITENAIWVVLDGSSNEEEVHRETWESIEYHYDKTTQRVSPEVVGTYTQFPIALAWAMTIHKAQGLTLEDVRIDLGNGAFSPGQTYVALSRARSLEGLSFSRPLRVSDVKADTKLVEGVRRIAEIGEHERG
jgi:GTPase SAR1 family protein